jgi:molybdate transport system substrate-binding protein
VRNPYYKRLLPLIALLIGTQAAADDLQVAMASNFAGAGSELAQLFEQKSGHRVRLAFGSTGKQYAQIVNGAPFDAYFAGDAERPEKLERQGLIRPGSRFTYALGRLVLWSPAAGLAVDGAAALRRGEFRHLAVANPKLAPYGRAARETLQRLGLWDGLRSRMVRGENIGQTFQFVKSGNAELGLVAASQARGLPGSRWEVPQDLYTPIVQQAVLLKDTPAGRDFLAFVRGKQGRELILAHGYGLPR